ncbi:MAG: hypothetical protein GY722_29885, partial [bacterium]|nr:hypothetical protein [bacterium]
MTAYLPLLLAAGGLSAAPIAVNVDSGNLYEIDLATGEYSLAGQFDNPVPCGPLTGTGDALFCTAPGTWVRRLDRSSFNVVWEVNFPDLAVPDAIAYSDSLLYVVAHESQPRRYYLLTVDPSTGGELARIWLSDLGHVDGGLQVPYALAPRGPELWLLRTGSRVGLRAHRLDPVTGKTLESFDVPEAGVVDDADFEPGGRLWLSYWTPDPINFGWCTHYFMVPFLSAPAELQFSHCWEPPDPFLPDLAHFTFAN